MTQVPLLDLQAQYRAAARRDPRGDRRASATASASSWGRRSTALERELARMLGVRHAIAVSSGTDALLLALMALGIRPATKSSRRPTRSSRPPARSPALGATPVLVDIDPATFNIDPGAGRGGDHAADQGDHAGPPVRPVRRHGSDPRRRRPRRHPGRSRTRRRRSARPTSRGRSAAIGAFGCFSFFPSKNLGAFGDAGLRHDQRRRAREARAAAAHARHGAEVLPPPRRRQLPDGRAAGGGAAREGAAPGGVDRGAPRERRALSRRCSATPGSTSASTLPVEPPDRRHIFNQFVIRTPDRDALKRHLDAHGIGNEIYYPVPFHLQPCFADLGYRRGDFPHAERAAAREPRDSDLRRAHRRRSRRRVVDADRASSSQQHVGARAMIRSDPAPRACRRRRSRLPGAHDADLHRPAARHRRRLLSGRASASPIKPLADAFLRMIKMIIAPLLFSTLVVGIAGTGDLKAMGRIGLKAIVYFEVATTIALFLGLALVNVFKPGAGLALPIGADTQRRGGDGAEPAARLGHLPAPVPDLGRRRDGARRHPAGRRVLDVLRRRARGDRRRRGSRCSTCSRAPRRRCSSSPAT